MTRYLLFIFFSICISSLIGAQDTIRLANPSFEDEPRMGVYYKSRIEAVKNNIEGWYDCGIIIFPAESAPDIHSATTKFWKVKNAPSHGKTYLGLSARDNESYESVGQELVQPLQHGKCYSFTVDLSQAETFISGSRINQDDKDYYYDTPIVLRIWGGDGYCGKKHLLYATSPIDHQDWKSYEITFSPPQSFQYLTLEVYYQEDIDEAYNGHILVDNISEIVEVECVE